jgi:hypothetical protein
MVPWHAPSMAEHPKAEWFQVQALECIALALRAQDPRIKRLYALEAERWLRLTKLKADSVIRGSSAAEYRIVERRMTPRHQSPKAGVMLLERAFRVECMVRNFSPAGVGLLVPDTIILPNNFYLIVNCIVRRCITVWRQFDRMGAKFKSMLGHRLPAAKTWE